MNLIKKSTLALFILPIVALASCSGGNGLVNEKQVDAQVFASAVAGTASKNTYNHCEATQTFYISTAGTHETTFTYDYNSVTQKWIPITTPAWSVDHASDIYASIGEVFKTLGITDFSVNFYTADNGFRITAVGEGVVDKANTSTNVEYIFNEYGFPTKFYQKTDATNGAASATTQVDVVFKYNSKN